MNWLLTLMGGAWAKIASGAAVAAGIAAAAVAVLGVARRGGAQSEQLAELKREKVDRDRAEQEREGVVRLHDDDVLRELHGRYNRPD